MAGCNKSGRLLSCTEAYFVMQVLDEPARRDVLFDLLLTNKEKLVEDMKLNGSLSCGNQETGVYNPEMREQDKQQDYNPGTSEEQIFPCSGACGKALCRAKGPTELVGLPGPNPVAEIRESMSEGRKMNTEFFSELKHKQEVGKDGS